MSSTIICLHGGDLGGRYDTSRQDLPSEVMRISQGTPGEQIAGYVIETAPQLGSRRVIHARAVEDVQRAVESEQREQAEQRAPWLTVPSRR